MIIRTIFGHNNTKYPQKDTEDDQKGLKNGRRILQNEHRQERRWIITAENNVRDFV